MSRADKLSVWGGALGFAWGAAWKIVERAGDVEYLMGLSPDSPLLRWLVESADYFLIVGGAALVALGIWRQPLMSRVSEGYRQRRRCWELRHWTDIGLNWTVLTESHKQGRDGRMSAVLAIAPVPGVELPQPLEIIVTCAGNIAGVGTTFYADPAREESPSRSGDVEVEHPEGKSVALRLRSPKLTPPARWDLTLTMAGNAEVKVLDVRRAPRRIGAPETRLH